MLEQSIKRRLKIWARANRRQMGEKRFRFCLTKEMKKKERTREANKVNRKGMVQFDKKKKIV